MQGEGAQWFADAEIQSVGGWQAALWHTQRSLAGNIWIETLKSVYLLKM